VESSLLEVNQLKTYLFVNRHIVKAVDDVSFNIQEGETVAIVGESGSGKSMTALSIMRLIDSPPGKIVDGSIRFSGKDLLNYSEEQMRKSRGKEISIIFQEPMTSLNPGFTIGEQIAEGIRLHEKITKEKAYKRAEEMLKLVGFARAKETLGEYPHQLSGGMRQRVMIAMAMSCNPRLLIADEPTTALDVTIQAQILELMTKVKAEFNSSILLITHDMGVVAETAQRVLIMYGGQIVEEASVEQLFKTPKHPYTMGLLESIPQLDKDYDRLPQISGQAPTPGDLPIGCRFAPRCSQASSECVNLDIYFTEIEPGHRVRCNLYEK
jgi:peptide/nickel transport system ATP-binding protein